MPIPAHPNLLILDQVSGVAVVAFYKARNLPGTYMR